MPLLPQTKAGRGGGDLPPPYCQALRALETKHFLQTHFGRNWIPGMSFLKKSYWLPLDDAGNHGDHLFPGLPSSDIAYGYRPRSGERFRADATSLGFMGLGLFLPLCRCPTPGRPFVRHHRTPPGGYHFYPYFLPGMSGFRSGPQYAVAGCGRA